MRRLRQTPSTFFDGWTEQNDHAPADRDTPRWRSRRWRLGTGAAALVAGAGATVTLVLLGQSASADPSAHTWLRLRMCESSDNYSINTGNGYYGAYQFDLTTWQSVGGSGYPNQASKAEQDARALILYRERGWQPWTCASILGLREDKDARSGRISDIKIGGKHTGGNRHTGGIPAFPGTRWYHFGDNNADIKTFQDEMHQRGYFPAGTGQYGPLTLHMVKKLQRLNGLVPNGYIGPNTWRLAWTGKYTTSHPHQHAHRPVHTIPAFPGSRWYHYGDNNADIKTFQDEMHQRGYFPAGTGQYGPLTLHMVKKLQRLNGLVPNGYIGPNTWRLAWTGKYTTSHPHQHAHRPVHTIPAYPGSRWYHYGDNNADIKTFQDEMHQRGYFPAGTGQYGPLTLHMVKKLQRINGLVPNGYIGPNTWRLAWTGKYHA